MTVPSSTADSVDMAEWTTVNGVDGFTALNRHEPRIDLLSDPQSFSLTQRAGSMGGLIVAEVIVGADMEIHCGELCSAYRVNVLRSGSVESVHRGASFVGGPGTAAVYQPEDDSHSRWVVGSRVLGVKIDRCAVEDAMSNALGRELMSQIDFTPCMSIETRTARSWINLLALLAEQSFRPDSVLCHPLAGLPFVDSLVRGLLLAADNPYRRAVLGETDVLGPRSVRAAVEILEEQAHRPWTVSSLAAHCNVSVRSLQEGFRRHFGTSPMAYLRAVRLRHAHQALLESDPSTTSVASVASRWGFTNFGRFSTAYNARYGEPPVATLRVGFRRQANRA